MSFLSNSLFPSVSWLFITKKTWTVYCIWQQNPWWPQSLNTGVKYISHPFTLASLNWDHMWWFGDSVPQANCVGRGGGIGMWLDHEDFAFIYEVMHWWIQNLKRYFGTDRSMGKDWGNRSLGHILRRSLLPIPFSTSWLSWSKEFALPHAAYNGFQLYYRLRRKWNQMIMD